jgi:hypothetical protein
MSLTLRTQSASIQNALPDVNWLVDATSRLIWHASNPSLVVLPSPSTQTWEIVSPSTQTWENCYIRHF